VDEDARRATLAVAEAVAPGWERWRARLEATAAPVREWLIRALAPRPGDTVLELAAGVGDTGLEAAAMVGERGRLISTDVSPAMVAAARRRGGELEVRNADYLAMDAEHLELDSDSVDGVLCRFGLMLMADPAAALSETRRVLRPGGRVALAVWSAPERNPWLSICARLVVERGHMPPPEPSAPGPFSLASEERVRALLEAAGLEVTRTDEAHVRAPFSDVDEYLRYTADTAGPMALVLRGLTDGERLALRGRLEAAFAPFVVDGGYVLPGVALTAAASPRV